MSSVIFLKKFIGGFHKTAEFGNNGIQDLQEQFPLGTMGPLNSGLMFSSLI